MEEDENYKTTLRQVKLSIDDTAFKECVSLADVTEESWTEENDKVLDNFIDDTSIPCIVVYLDASMILQVGYSVPSKMVEQLDYFIRAQGAVIMPETFDQVIQYGHISGDPTKCLLDDMLMMHSPVVALSTEWEKSLKDAYTDNMHCQLLSFTDEVYKKVDRIVLYIPVEGLLRSPEEACKDRKLVQRMETIMIHWTDQTKELLNSLEWPRNDRYEGPLGEITFWKTRSAKLLDMSQQLQKPQVSHIQRILQLSNSLYVQRFSKLASEIQDCFAQAKSNLEYLSILKGPCQELTKLKPREAIPKLPDIFVRICTIWRNSTCYNTEEKIIGLLRKTSNDILHLCCQSISLERVFKGFVISSKETLTNCIACCEAWKETYLHKTHLQQSYAPKGWALDHTSIFVLVDAFIQRFRELLEVCDCQHQFARWEDGQQRPLPCLGFHGQEDTRSLLDLERIFHCGLQKLYAVDKGILDVENTMWYNEFNRFQLLIKDVERRVQSLINSMFKSVNKVEEGVWLLDIFRLMSSREAIKRTTDEKAEAVYNLAIKDLKVVSKAVFRPSLPDYMPRLAGHAQWVMALKHRVEKPMEVLQNATFLPMSETRKLVFATYDQMVQVADDTVAHCYSDWFQGLDGQCLQRLNQPLLIRFKGNPIMLDENFDKYLSNLFSEIHYWDRLKFEVPQSVSDIYRDKDELHILKERVMQVVRGYNRIIRMLSPDERGLFRDQIGFLDRKIQPGLKKHTWLSKVAATTFIRDCLPQIDKVQSIVDRYKGSNLAISNLCQKISKTQLIKLDGKTVYRNLDFEDEQKDHQNKQLEKLGAAHKEIIDIMSSTQDIFSSDGAEVQHHWSKYEDKVDHLIEKTFRSIIKQSMQKLSRAINGDDKTSPNPLFKVLVSLRQSSPQSTPKVELSPTLGKLAELVNILPQLIKLISEFKRLPEILSNKSSQRNPIYISIEQDEDIKKIQAAVATGMTANATVLQSYMKTWDRYRDIWEINKNSFIQRYKRLNPPATSFDADIHAYTEKATSVQQEETVLNIGFVLVDCSMLKLSLVRHCSDWQTEYTKLLSSMAGTRLNNLHAFFLDNANRLKQTPQTLVELGESLKLLETLQSDLSKTGAQIPLIHEQFAILDKYEVPLDTEVQELREKLDGEWVWFQQVLIDSNITLQKHKQKFKENLIVSSEDFRRKIHTTVQDFNGTGPFDSALSCEVALEQIKGHRRQLEALKKEEGIILHGLSFFNIDQSPSKSIITLEKDIDHLQQVWEITQKWNTNWDTWKVTHFASIQTDMLKNQAQAVFRKLQKLQKELKDKDWNIVVFLRNKIDHFKKLIPIIADLRNPAMRERHWKQVCDEAQITIDPTCSDFTLEMIGVLGLDKFADKISAISGNASKELMIEQGLEVMTKTWDDVCLDIIPYKEGYFRLRGNEDVFQTMEDNMVILSTMKASRFVKSFEQEVNIWEHRLSLMLEVLEMLLVFQRHWIYLENIFQGKDIREQLLSESKEFDNISSSWETIMSQLQKNNNALQGTHHPGLLEKLSDMCTRIEKIEKALQAYLESKRQIFPRFYFLSNDELLEILGQPQTVQAIEPHVKKCFDNIKHLEIEKKGAVGMYSADGELVPFLQSIKMDKPVEIGLCDIEEAMRNTLKESQKDCVVDLKKMMAQKDKWIKAWPGQILITTSQVQWTQDVTKAIMTVKERADTSSLESMKNKQVSLLNSYSEIIRGNQTEVLRLKMVALVTVEVHARDIIDKLAKSGCNDVNAFDWQCQLRFYWDKGQKECTIRQTNTQFRYGFEYLGNSGRLIITPLTDRCYLTLTTSLHLHRVGSPKGPAGTGKTETVKDLGRTLGQCVIVINCSKGLDYKSMGRMFSGLAQTGMWGCFDEFHHINVEVLSVVAQQILSILSALSTAQLTFNFNGQDIRLIHSCGIFIPTNPAYAFQTELPENLKSVFRPVSMAQPDSAVITEVILFGEGFNNSKVLSKKLVTLYSLAEQQLSKQDHYDFGLRALTYLVRYAGRKRRSLRHITDEEEILLLAMKDMNIARLTSVDQPLFTGIIHDLFPDVESPDVEYGKIIEAIEAELHQKGLQVTDFTMTKVTQLYETKNSRHSTILVGNTGSGKTVTWTTLQNALSALHQKREPGFHQVQVYTLNPKSMSLGELYGGKDLSTNEWTDGVLPSVIRTACADEKPDEKWIVFDGPVDTLWIESMNSVMDDSKILTLVNGERIPLPEQLSLLFEVGNLATASPATVSRCGVVYNDHTDLGWKPYAQSWLDKRDKAEADHLNHMFEKYVESTFTFKKNNCKDPTPVTELNGVMSLCRLYDCLATSENGINIYDTENLGRMVELWFVFCLIWSICASVNDDGRKKMDFFLRDMGGTFPIKDTVYEYYVDTKKRTWTAFEEKLPKAWRYNANAPFHTIMVQTVDTIRFNLLVKPLMMAQHPVLLTGSVGSGKTSVIQSILRGLDSKKWTAITINMFSQMSSNDIQARVDSHIEKRTKTEFVPLGGKSLLCFLDDFNLPSYDTFGSQPPLELLRHFINYGFWYDVQKQTPKFVKNMYLLASMGPPGGGRTHISSRLLSRFNLMNMTMPNDSQIARMFSIIIKQKLEEFKDEVKPIGEVLTEATLEIYHAVTDNFLPSPAKSHYIFNLRDISKVFQGLLRAHPEFHETKNGLIRLWIHECFRVFSDRFINHSDGETFITLLSQKLGTTFDLTFHSICPNKQSPLFGDFLSESHIYEDLLDMKVLKHFMERQLEKYNLTPGLVPMNLVLFREAIDHVTRVVRVISQLRGHMLLVGVGGSGMRSLSKLAAFICHYEVFQIGVPKQDFREDIRKLFYMTGVDNKPTVFLLSDTKIINEAFLEDICNILSMGIVPNLYSLDEFVEVPEALADAAWKANVPETPEAIFNYFIERVKKNVHIILCMNPVGVAFRKRILQYPALVGCTTIDWFHEWPRDALLEVAESCLNGVELGSLEGSQMKVANIFVTTHQSVEQASERMKLELRRHNYVTAVNYLEVVLGFKKLLAEKRKELGDQISKLRNGLFNIGDTRVKVESMTIEMEEAKKQVAQFQKQCDTCLSDIIQQKLEADAQKKAVSDNREKIAKEETECLAMAENAQRDLDQALPALEAAMKALESLNKKDMTEIKTYDRPPGPVETVMYAIMILLNKEPTWPEAKRQLGEANFIKTLVNFDKDSISERVLKKISRYCSMEDFKPDIIGKVSLAAKSLCMWVRAMEVYGRVYRVMEPKRAQLNAAQAQLYEKQAALAEDEQKLREVGEKKEQLEKLLAEKNRMKDSLKQKSEDMAVKLDLADKMVSGLAGEKVRWEERVNGLEENMECLVGDCLLAASFLSYLGPFLSNYREELLTFWLKELQDLEVPCSPEFTFADFLSRPITVREWNVHGLPADDFSTENAVIVTRGNRWPLMVDPQGQALKWIKNIEVENGLRIIDFQMPDYLQILENAIQLGNPVLLQNVQEHLEPTLSPILNKSLTQTGGTLLLKLADKEIKYSPDFRFYITTKLSNPHYTAATCTKANIVNFVVNKQGLEAQLLGIVVRKERPDLEEQKDSLVNSISSGKRSLHELEDEILRLLNESTGALLDDEHLVNTLQTSKETATEVAQQLENSEKTENEIDAAREAYRPCAQRASVLFCILNDMFHIDPVYQFSLDAYIQLYIHSIKSSKRNNDLEKRIAILNDYHTDAVYRFTCRSLFEVHRLLFSFQICVKILEESGKLNMDEYNFFLRGGLVLEKDKQMDNPCSSWLPESSWENILTLEKQQSFHGITASFENRPKDWNLWFTSEEPDNATLPGTWENHLNEFQRIMIVRSLREDRVPICVTSFIYKNLGPRFVESPDLDMKGVVEESTCTTPLIFVLSPGVDPTAVLQQLAEACGMSKDFHALSMGQGQAPIAKNLIKDGVKNGHWVFLANCHLCLSWMPELEKLVEQLEVENPHSNFRLWLSSLPHPEFPVTILQAGIKMATETPKGVKANMKRLYKVVTEERFDTSSKPSHYKKLLFSLCFLHCILKERKKFLQLGWNKVYDFSDSDFEMSENLLSLYLNKSDDIPWGALKYLIGGINYGGHVTDEWDKRLLTTYINDYFSDAVVEQPLFKLSSLSYYYVPADGSWAAYVEHIAALPPTEQPEAFGLHSNADVASQIAETRTLLDSLLSLQPQITIPSALGSGLSREEKVLEMLADIRQTIPKLIDQEATKTLLQENPSPLNRVLLQEIERYNALLDTITSSLNELENGIRGIELMSPSLEEMFNCIYDACVPPLWEKAYLSVKPLALWTSDLSQRVNEFAQWAKTTQPPNVFWLSAFTSPNSFLTSVLQSFAREHTISVDTLSWDFLVLFADRSSILTPAKDGVFVQGLYLEGAGWNKMKSCLTEAEPMQMTCVMPVIHFKPVATRKKMAKNAYMCPCYYYPVRSDRSSFVIGIKLNSGSMTPEHWVKRGTALLLSLDS